MRCFCQMICFILLKIALVGAMRTFEMEMPVVDVPEPDTYLCSASKFEGFDRSHIVKVRIDVDVGRVHHASTSVCEVPRSHEKIWDCKHTQGTNCDGASAAFSGWDDFTRQKDDFIFPKDLSVEVGTNTSLKYLVLQIHYADPVRNQNTTAAKVKLTLQDEPTPYRFQKYLLANNGYIPANASKGYQTNSACRWKLPSVKAYQYFVHTHYKGYHAEAFLIRNNTWILLGSVLPQLKTREVYPIPGGPIEILPGDILAGRCLFINNQTKPVKFGMEEDAEMCNFELDFGYEKKHEEHFKRPLICQTESPDFSFKNFPGLLDYF